MINLIPVFGSGLGSATKTICWVDKANADPYFPTFESRKNKRERERKKSSKKKNTLIDRLLLFSCHLLVGSGTQQNLLRF